MESKVVRAKQEPKSPARQSTTKSAAANNRAKLRRCIATKAKREGISYLVLEVRRDTLIVLFVTANPSATDAERRREFDQLGKHICSCLKRYRLRGVTQFAMAAYRSKEDISGGGGDPLMADPPGGGGDGGNTCKDPRFKPSR